MEGAAINYYEHHLGDYLRDTAHLSMLEDAAYRRLLDAYYIREAPLPGDLRECCKLARAVSKPEREAVAYVLREFFALVDGAHRQRRADGEIARFQDKQRKASASAQARWGKSKRNADVDANACDGNANACSDPMRTHCEGNAHQTPDTIQLGSTEASTQGYAGTDAGRACLLMRQAGCAQVNPSHPDLIAALAEGVSPETLADAWRDWHNFRNQRKGWTPKARELSLATLRRLHADGNDPVKVINRSIERGWTGLFPLPENERHANRNPGRKLSAVEQVQQAILDRRAQQPDDESPAAA